MPLTAAAATPLLGDRRRFARYLLLGTGACAAGYGVYRLYHSQAAADGRRQLSRLRAALAAYSDAFGTGADTLQLLLADLRSFLQSDRTEVPPSLRQLARLMQSQEMADTTSATVAALVRGVTSAGSSPLALIASDGKQLNGGSHSTSHSMRSGGALDRVLEALLSERGQGLVSVAVSLGARNLVSAYCETQHRLAAQDAAVKPPPPDVTQRLLSFLASSSGQQLAVLTIGAFVSSGMKAYLDQTMDLNLYEDLFAAMSKPEHLEAVKQCVGVLARDVVATYLARPAAIQEPPAAAAPQQQQPPPRAQMRLHTSIHELPVAPGGDEREQQQLEGEEDGEEGDPGSPSGSSASGEWPRQRMYHAAAASAPAAPSDIDSDVLLPPEAAAAKRSGGSGDDSARSHDSAAWAVRTPPAAAEGQQSGAAKQGAIASSRVPPQIWRVQQQEAAAASAGMQREGSGNLEWISAVSKEWLNVAQNPHGRTVMVELAGTAAKEAARGMGAGLADQFNAQWLMLAAVALLMLAWLMQRLIGTLLL